MAEENTNNTSNETNEENVSREEETNEQQGESTQNQEDSGNENPQTQESESDARLARLESSVERILGEISSIREAQGIMVENGAVISEPDADLDFTDADSFVPPSEMDLLI